MNDKCVKKWAFCQHPIEGYETMGFCQHPDHWEPNWHSLTPWRHTAEEAEAEGREWKKAISRVENED